jgi:glycosyltransferase involved in cell wall biosynthesis
VETIGCGFWVEQNVQAIADAVCCLLDQPQQAAAMGERGARWAREKFSWDAVAERMIDCYGSILNQQQ